MRKVAFKAMLSVTGALSKGGLTLPLTPLRILLLQILQVGRQLAILLLTFHNCFQKGGRVHTHPKGVS